MSSKRVCVSIMYDFVVGTACRVYGFVEGIVMSYRNREIQPMFVHGFVEGTVMSYRNREIQPMFVHAQT